MPFSPSTFSPSGETRKDRVRAADAHRGSAASRGYGRRWQKLRASFLARHPICMCGSEDCGRPATEVDHIIPHRGDERLMWDWENLQSLTKECHAAKTRREGPRPIR